MLADSKKSFADDLWRVSELREAGLALASYASAISGSSLNWETEQYVLRPNDFVTFRVQPRHRSVLLVLRGYPTEFAQIDGVTINAKMGRGSYSSCKITKVDQLAAASIHIRRALELARRGRNRIKRRLVLKEEEIG